MVLLLNSTRGQYPGVTGPINTDQPKPHVSQKAVYTYTCTVFPHEESRKLVFIHLTIFLQSQMPINILPT